MPVRAQDYNIGENAYKRGDFETALQHFRPLAKKGHAKAQEHLGFMYSNGLGVSQDYLRSLKWFSKAAEQNNAHAQHNLGIIHGNGLGVQRDHYLAYIWFNIAAANGHTASPLKRDLAATRLNPADLERAQKIARKCLLQPRGCGQYALPG